MEFTFAKRLDSFQAGIFAVLNEKKNELEASGRKVYNLSVGTPDFEPPAHVMEAVAKAAKKPENYKYSIVDIPQLLDAVSSYYGKRFGVTLAHDEIMSIYGSQEGMAHISLALCDPGDVVLVPNPGYPIFEIGPYLCGAKPVYYDLDKNNNFLPDLSKIPPETARTAKFMVVSYPLNPVCAAAPDSFYEALIKFANAYDIIIIHDNAYSDIIFDGRVGRSFLSFEGAKEVGVEFYSLSKSFNFTGARMSFVVGNREIIEKFKTIRSQIDYGIFLPIQYGAIAALTGPQEGVVQQCRLYEERSKVLCGGLRSIGWDVPDSQGTMFVWAPLPKGYDHSETFCMELMNKAGVVCVPGSSFGTLGEGFVRFALVYDRDILKEIVETIKKSGIIKENA